MEQQENNKFCSNLGKMPIETYELLQTICGDEALSRSSVFDWFKQFEDEREDLQNNPWAPIIMTDELNINKETSHQILHEDLRKTKT
jgi:hypothetical protein